jgi:hypothetical protein
MRFSLWSCRERPGSPSDVDVVWEAHRIDPVGDTSFDTSPRAISQAKLTGPAAQTLAGLCKDQSPLATGEVFLTYTPIFPFITGIFSYEGGEFYGVTAF